MPARLPLGLSHVLARFRFPGTLRARLTAAFSSLILLAALLVTLALVSHSVTSQLEAQRRIGASLLDILVPALQIAVRQNNNVGFDTLVGHAAEDAAVTGLRVRDKSGVTLYEYARADEPAAWYTRWFAPTSA
ncbi:MAG: hypothetical protein ACJ8KA_15750, partial [Sulfurifustis sp.]